MSIYIQKDIPGYEPNEHTLAYYPLTTTTTVNDMKGSGTAYNLTNNWDVTFWTYDWVGCAKFWWTQNTSCLYYNSSLFTWSAEFTVSVWHKQIIWYSWYHNNILSVWTHNGTNGFIEWINNTTLYVWWWTNDRNTWYTMTVWDWRNIVYTHKNGTIKVYVNWALKYTGTVSFNIQNWRTILWWWISNQSSYVSSDNFQWYLSDAIFENVEWSAQDVQDYYDLTVDRYFSKRKPNANTIAYYKFDWNLNDSSGNWYNWSMRYGSFTYSTLSSWEQYLYSNWANYSNNITIPYNPQSYTVNVWCKYWSSSIFLDFQPARTGVNSWPRFQRLANNSLYLGSQPYVSWTFTQWTNVVLVLNPSNSQFYINWQYVSSWNAMQTWYSTTNLSINTAWLADNPTSQSWTNYMDEIIIEDRPRTTAEITDYYNLTKWNYWL